MSDAESRPSPAAQAAPERRRSDPELVAACIAGEAVAWKRLVDRYGRLVYSIALDYGMSRDDADDVFQNVFVIVHRKLGNLRDRTRLSSWLITTTHRECWRLRRARGGGEPVVRDERVAPEEIERWELRQTVRELLERVGSPCRELLMALFLDETEPSYRSIAQRLDLPIGSIGPTRARCFRKLEKLMDETGVDPRSG